MSDDRGSDNRYQVCKHNKSNKKQEHYRIERRAISCRRLTSRYYIKNMLIDYDNCLDGDETEEFEFLYYNKHDSMVWALCYSTETDDIDRLKTLLLYSSPALFKKSINIFGSSKRSFYPIETLLTIAAHEGNDRLVRMYLTEPFDVDINALLDGYKTDKYWDNNFLSCKCCAYCNGMFSGTALWFACFHGHLNVVRTLIELGKADVNLANYRNQTPLRAAISQKHFNIVTYLIEQANANIDEDRDLFIAIKYGSYEIVNYLLNKGCDPNTRLIDQDSEYELVCHTPFALHYAVKCNNPDLSIIKILLEHGGDPTFRDDHNQTALHVAIEYEYEQILKEILHYKFTHDQRDNDNLTPLMLAIVMNKTNIINLLYEMLPRQQYIDELMLLACHYALENRFDFVPADPLAFIYFEQALRSQQPNSNAIPCDIYQFQRECQTTDELTTIRYNSELMYIQSLLVYERLLPQRDEIYLLIPKLLDLCDSYWDREQYDRCLSILIHTYTLSLSCKENSFNHWDIVCLELLESLLGLLIVEEEIKSIDKVFQAFECAFNRLSDVEKVCRLCIYVAYLIKSDQINNDNKLQLIRWVKQTMRRSYFTELYGKILFEQVLLICVENNELFFDRVLPKNVVHLLIQCGADVNEIVPKYGCRPLHLVAYTNNTDVALPIIEILIAAGAHTDCLDFGGFLPEARANNNEIRQFLYSKRSMSLKCQCAHLILSKNINYESYLSKNLKNFILMHQSR